MQRRRLVVGRFLTALCGVPLLVPVLAVLLALSFSPIALSQDVSPVAAGCSIFDDGWRPIGWADQKG